MFLTVSTRTPDLETVKAIHHFNPITLAEKKALAFDTTVAAIITTIALGALLSLSGINLGPFVTLGSIGTTAAGCMIGAATLLMIVNIVAMKKRGTKGIIAMTSFQTRCKLLERAPSWEKMNQEQKSEWRSDYPKLPRSLTREEAAYYCQLSSAYRDDIQLLNGIYPGIATYQVLMMEAVEK